jgi:hypothetical protein
LLNNISSNNHNNNNNSGPNIDKEPRIKRHDRECGELHFTMCKELGVQRENEDWYEHVAKLVETSRETIVTT